MGADVSLAAMIVGHMVAEYLLQPEVVQATKRAHGRESYVATAVHGFVWIVCVVVFGGPWPVDLAAWREAAVPVVVLALTHCAIDCTDFRIVLHGMTKTASLDRAVEQVSLVEEQKGAPAEPGWTAVSLAYGVIGDKLFDLAAHCAILYAYWRVVTA